MRNTLMIDIETLSTDPKAVVTEIGAAGYDKSGSKMLYSERIELKSQLERGRVIDPYTIEWWMGQSDEARSSFKEHKVDTKRALEEFLVEVVTRCDLDDLVVLGNGANFDITIMESLLKDFKLNIPWKFWNIRCYRTIKNMYPEIKMDRSGVHHKAVDDANSQLDHLMKIQDKHNQKYEI
jgi:hypothetical protein